MKVHPVSPDHPDVQRLIRILDAYQNGLYPAESNHLDSIETLKSDNVIMLGARDETDGLAGIGALKIMDGYAEIKRMIVADTHRRRGVGRLILEALAHQASARGISLLRLETGIRQDAAIGLYSRAGFKQRGPFGAYPDDPLSLFMEKSIR